MNIDLLTRAVALFVAGVAIRVSLWIVYRGWSTADRVYITVRLGALILIAVALSGLAIGLLNFIGIPFIVVAAVIWFMTAMQFSLLRKQALMQVLALSIEKQIPIPAIVSAFAEDQRLSFGRKIWRWAGRLKRGMPLVVALERSQGVLPREAGFCARIGQAAGDLSAGLRVGRMNRLFQDPIWHATIGRLLYLGWLVFGLLPIVLGFVVVRIVPTFNKIMEDFDFDAPVQRSGVLYWFSFAGPVMGYVSLAGVALMFAFTLHYIGVLPDGFPGFAWLSKRLDAALILRALALAIQRQRPLNTMLDTLVVSYPKSSIRRKLRRAQAEMDAGQTWHDSLRRQRLITTADAAVLSAAVRAGNLEWALNEIADGIERRIRYRATALAQLILPIGVIIVGSLVGYVAVTLFAPLGGPHFRPFFMTASRRGVLLLELILTTVLLGTLATLVLQFFVQSAALRRESEHRTFAAEHAANLLEQFVALSPSEITTEKLGALAQAERADKALPGEQVNVTVDERQTGKRISVEVQWKHSAAGGQRSVRLTTWVFNR